MVAAALIVGLVMLVVGAFVVPLGARRRRQQRLLLELESSSSIDLISRDSRSVQLASRRVASSDEALDQDRAVVSWGFAQESLLLRFEADALRQRFDVFALRPQERSPLWLGAGGLRVELTLEQASSWIGRPLRSLRAVDALRFGGELGPRGPLSVTVTIDKLGQSPAWLARQLRDALDEHRQLIDGLVVLCDSPERLLAAAIEEERPLDHARLLATLAQRAWTERGQARLAMEQLIAHQRWLVALTLLSPAHAAWLSPSALGSLIEALGTLPRVEHDPYVRTLAAWVDPDLVARHGARHASLRLAFAFAWCDPHDSAHAHVQLPQIKALVLDALPGLEFGELADALTWMAARPSMSWEEAMVGLRAARFDLRAAQALLELLPALAAARGALGLSAQATRVALRALQGASPSLLDALGEALASLGQREALDALSEALEDTSWMRPEAAQRAQLVAQAIASRLSEQAPRGLLTLVEPGASGALSVLDASQDGQLSRVSSDD